MRILRWVHFFLLFAFLAAYAANLAFFASFTYENTNMQNRYINTIIITY